MVTLLPCQIEAANDWVRLGGRGFLVSPVGNGKSLVAAECFRRSIVRYNLPALYLTTKSAIKGQCAELRSLGVAVKEANIVRNERVSLWSRPENGTVYVTTLEAIGCDEKEWNLMRRINWGCIAIDEADRLTAGASKRNRRLLTLKPKHKLLMTGTPLRNGLKDVYFPVMFLND